MRESLATASTATTVFTPAFSVEMQTNSLDRTVCINEFRDDNSGPCPVVVSVSYDDQKKHAKSLNDEQLCDLLEGTFAHTKRAIAYNLPYLAEARSRFMQRGRRIPILGQPSWSEWISANLGISDRHVRRLLAKHRKSTGQSVARQSKSKSPRTKKTPTSVLAKQAIELAKFVAYDDVEAAKQLAFTILSEANVVCSATSDKELTLVPPNVEEPEVVSTSEEARSIGVRAFGKSQIHSGDVFDVLATLPDNSYQGCLSDPPYNLGFMGKKWDSTGVAFNAALWKEVLRVLAPGAYLLAFGGSRTFHRLTTAIEDAGFEVRDHLMWVYGNGMPKSKASLKPALEPIVLARKPASIGVPLNIEHCRIGLESLRRSNSQSPTLGRWPSNLLLDEVTAQVLDLQSGEVGEGYGTENRRRQIANDDQGGVSRFFYCSKASKSERNAACDSFDANPTCYDPRYHQGGGRMATRKGNPHPCVKPLDVCRWLATLIQPQSNGKLLVPFAGSGSEMIGALQAGWSQVDGIELDPTYARVADARLQHWTAQPTPRSLPFHNYAVQRHAELNA